MTKIQHIILLILIFATTINYVSAVTINIDGSALQTNITPGIPNQFFSWDKSWRDIDYSMILGTPPNISAATCDPANQASSYNGTGFECISIPSADTYNQSQIDSNFSQKANKTTYNIEMFLIGQDGLQNFSLNDAQVINSSELWVNGISIDLFSDYNESCLQCINISKQLNYLDKLKVKYVKK